MDDEGNRYGQPWTRDELVLALYYYCRIPFARTKANNPEVRGLAEAIGRTPASVARKLGNFGAFDPTLSSRGIVGLSHGSKADRAVWEEFAEDWNGLVDEAEEALRVRHAPGAPTPPTGPSEVDATVRVRRHQAFFRQSVLGNYGQRCAVCQLDVEPLLVAGHIVPWSVAPDLRSNPYNGLCLCAVHERAFDRGLLCVTEEYLLRLSPRVQRSSPPIMRSLFADFGDRPIAMPERFAPDRGFLTWHRENVFDRHEPLG